MLLFRFSRRRSWLLGAAAAALVAGAAQAQPSWPVHVGGERLDAALLRLAAQTRQRILFKSAVVADLNAPAVAGDLTADEALARLLAGSGLRARRVSDQVIVIERATGVEAQKTTGAVAPTTPVSRDVVTAPADPEATSAAPAAAPTTLEELTVTGSNIRGVRTASPVVTWDRDDLERTGRTTLADALRTLPQNFNGGAADANVASFGDRSGRNGAFSTGLNLRGLGNNATLVLINGRRIAGSGAFGDFADVSSIPTAAVERVDVLLDGASAVYGADAVGGVVNIILRRDFDGAELRLLAGASTRGEPVEGQISGAIGRRWDSGHVMLTYELQRREGMSSADRKVTATSDLRPLGGSDHRQVTSFPGNILRTDPATGALVPGWAIPAGQPGTNLRPSDLQAGVVNLQNPRFGLDLLPRQTLNAVYLAGGRSFGDRLEITADARYSARRYRIEIAPPTANLTVNRNNPFFVSPNGSTSHTLAYSFAGDLESPIQQGLAETLSATLGGTLKLKGDRRLEAYVAFGQEIDESPTAACCTPPSSARRWARRPIVPTPRSAPCGTATSIPSAARPAPTPRR